ncbi:endonuclease III homologue, putative [Plasmodium knowlesi strain H]|uniref:Endonuclease III homolog n=3 Tax=Plasmodium knowlesi TaxID=5850 RepID=A0A5K1UQC7_PLAKH|nr:endonuclease III-like protein [Plasmodium knowlesi strain H]OTN64474.1 Endonuclease III-like protein [Plasmodium knowlesi]CAA9989177.1 endonuclease III-like protein 1, putative [Plasmodium knowlesi strain H]SBO27397.1 endonuclease III homologue, putative [Plasmodium knowlesi strain H]SBO27493.1 endonuclease III homologue, putative [Plasmodium knowlesi strain H]VVS78651.1 endonuclease III-like protein 1, putative [Plasmodium knowlesi strain H]|eukprot:XP_002261524.1 endonuclease III-like protein [Plasmodium knowlesi strain H]
MDRTSKYFSKERAKKISITYEDEVNGSAIRQVGGVEYRLKSKREATKGETSPHFVKEEYPDAEGKLLPVEGRIRNGRKERRGKQISQDGRRGTKRVPIEKHELREVNSELRKKLVKVMEGSAVGEGGGKLSGPSGGHNGGDDKSADNPANGPAKDHTSPQTEQKLEHFLQTYEKISKMRKHIVAPVDKYGCHMLSDKTESAKVYRFQTLVSCMLSTRTRDESTAMAMERLKKHGLTVHNMLKTSEEELKKLIQTVGFYKIKAKQIIQISQILRDKYDYDIPHTLEGLLELPGIGQKVAHLILQTALDTHEGIAVDIHVHRISNRLNWVCTKNESITQSKLESYVPRALWSELNKTLVGFGQVVCKAKSPHCTMCAVTNCCKYYQDTRGGKEAPGGK